MFVLTSSYSQMYNFARKILFWTLYKDKKYQKDQKDQKRKCTVVVKKTIDVF